MTADLLLRRYHQAPDGAPRLVCFPYAGGSASYFFPVAKAFAPDVDVVALQYPGRQDRRLEPVETSLVALADQVAPVLAAEPPAPTVFFGHSMGAVLAYETARRLERSGTVLAHLVVSGRRAPSRPRPEDDVHTRDDAGVLAEITRLGGPGSDLLTDPEIIALVLPAVRGDYTAIETYVRADGPPLRCPVTALTGDRDPRVAVDDVRGWAGTTTGPFDLHVLPGGHFFIGTQAPAVLDLIRRALPVRTP